ncbi:hypothetical protein IQ268_29125 [Oculatella sp. LEGE 06141]|uniref:hypothetical protein n=1 Tax=Oculatella sp. LEGE 06141 TaxID=1828648 RepID=UPI0018809405|nr:hypothetical protein [Oculatella sp. LEGE 06141]MBE9182616.1 hypothetical protein [Oculatella sp. LEGE 06141]
MVQTLMLREHAIVLVIPDFKPPALTLEMLHYSGCIPSEWELVHPPVYTQQATQFRFRNGICLTAYPERLLFSQEAHTQALSDSQIASLVHKYVVSFPHARYQAVGMNFHGDVAFPQGSDNARHFITQLLSPGPWQTLGQDPMQASLTCSYRLDRCQLNLAISSAMLRVAEEQAVPVVTFAANFNYSIPGNVLEDRLAQLLQALTQWQTNLDTYQELVNTRFLVQVNTTVDASEALVVGAGSC